MRLWRTPIQGCFWCLLWYASGTALADCVLRDLRPDLSWESYPYHIGTVHMCRDAAYADAGVLPGALQLWFQLPWVCIRCVRWHPPRASLFGDATELLFATPWKAWNSHSTRSCGVMVQAKSCNLVDPASSHMLVSKIKPCMSKYKLLYGETANGSLKQLSSP